jgi:hypothetical protein
MSRIKPFVDLYSQGPPRSDVKAGCDKLLDWETDIAEDLEYVYLGVLPMFVENCGLVV